MAEKIVPVVKAEEAEEEELVDPQETLRGMIPMKFGKDSAYLKEACSQKKECQNQWAKYQECNDRVNSRSNTAETCEEELIDYVTLLDKCVSKDLFSKLK